MKISIITVCLNSERTIEQTIKSVIEQNYDDLEYIIIDGKSTDGTLGIINKYKNNICKIISEKDDGIYDAMNKGIALATGEIIGIINSDDWYEPNTLKTINQCFQEPNIGVVYGNLNMVDESGETYQFRPGSIEKIRYEMETPHPTIFIKKELYIKYGMFRLNYKIAADYELMLRLYTEGVTFLYIDNVLANYRIGGISLQQEQRCAEETFAISKDYISFAPLNKKEYFENIINHKWSLFCLKKMMDNFSENLFNVLEMKLGVDFKENIVIFGAGNLGIKTCFALRKQGLNPLFFVDNNKERWNKSEIGIKILAPEALNSFQGILLIMVINSSTKILQQIKEIHNHKMHCIAWEEIAADFMMAVNET